MVWPTRSRPDVANVLCGMVARGSVRVRGRGRDRRGREGEGDDVAWARRGRIELGRVWVRLDDQGRRVVAPVGNETKTGEAVD